MISSIASLGVEIHIEIIFRRRFDRENGTILIFDSDQDILKIEVNLASGEGTLEGMGPVQRSVSSCSPNVPDPLLFQTISIIFMRISRFSNLEVAIPKGIPKS